VRPLCQQALTALMGQPGLVNLMRRYRYLNHWSGSL
jgi:hypothetical protein